MTGEIVRMAAMGLLTSVVAPAIVLLGAGRVPWHRVPAPPLVVLPAFVVLHGAITVAHVGHHLPPSGDGALYAVLLAGAVVFWLPVIGPGHHTPDPVRSVYLFLAGPSLDLAAVYAIIAGHSAGGIAMIVAMLPVGLAAIGVTWRWITREEHAWSA
ncbi:hypothetical protein [Qaidamihabitans albus]|uniref:hypothetical protein n=1 Tax=Qaidamihabitans albus TaxID=2795733 RepID=UPI0018F17482|nr:hypothetical protein [Qaidamihabitans albus]